MAKKGLLVFIVSTILLTLGNGAARSQVNRGSITSKEVCSMDSLQSYAYYLPTQYAPARAWPAIFVFEPLARGTLGVSVFKEIAETYGYLVFCSNNSKNGPVEDMISAANAMYEDAHRKFSLDQHAQIVSGFSGGARFALYLAMNSDVLDAVIACGAGRPVTGNIVEENSIRYFGIVGNADFNFAEMLDFKKLLDAAGWENTLSVFTGDHRWPPVAEIEQAILWIRFSHMKKEDIPVDYDQIDRYNVLMDSVYKSFIGVNDLVNAYRVAQNWQSALAGIAETGKPENYLRELVAGSMFQDMLSNYNTSMAAEIEKQKQYINEFSLLTLPGSNVGKPISWWKSEIMTLHDQATGAGVIQSSSARRLLSALGVNGYYASQSMFETGRYENARIFTEIWKLAEPESKYARMMSARLYILDEQPGRAITELKSAGHSGITRSELMSDSIIVNLSGNKKFDTLLLSLDP